eukprot:TRINITY_DN964_c0_g3_i1.p1 TRINITY_DN964_c0_g3~~TRINITY_DN964_c0_g3_i1.p1  ORF type:complete len:387 (+),score=43.31 TRINITY_DN964_c0_g3_i1:126-1163(+)
MKDDVAEPLPSETTPLVTRVTKEEERIQWSTICKIVLPPVVLVGSGVAVLRILEGWPVAICIYVISQMVTTVGWGDITVTSASAKVFMSFYAIAILTIIAYYDNFLSVCKTGFPSKKAISQLRREMDQSISRTPQSGFTSVAIDQFSSILIALSPILTFISIGTVYFFFNETCVCKKTIHFENQNDTCIDTSGFETCVETGGVTQGLVDIVYMSSISLSTIGFGDFHPRSSHHFGLTFAIIWTLFGVAATAVSVTNLSEAFFGMELAKQLEKRELVSCHVSKDGSGPMSRGEYLSMMVIKHDLISRGLIQEIDATYDSLDIEKTNSVPFAAIKSEKQEDSKGHAQ